MIDIMFVLVFQAAGGEPASPPESPAQTEQAAPSAQPAQADDDRTRRRCRVETVTGSRMGARVCRSQADEQAQSAEGRRVLENAMRMFDNQTSTSGGVHGP